ncbi:MAG: extracellular solute-binding protein [Pseudomonadota bacterium]
MKVKLLFMGIICLACFFVFGCQNTSNDQNETTNQKTDKKTDQTIEKKVAGSLSGHEQAKAYEILPQKIEWLTNDTDPVYASDKAQKGGIFHSSISSFPLTFRVVGPDSNSSFRGAILGNQMSLINIHPNTEHILPELATHWAYGADKKTMYFKLDKDARWSDNVPVTAWDYVYTLEFMRSEHIIAPWYNDYYTKEIEKVVVYDDYTIGVKSTKAVPDLHLKLGISPTPRHFFGTLTSTFVQDYNWKIVPNTGAYQISEFEKGKFVRFKRKPDWWAKDKQYFKHRFNVDVVVFDVIRDTNLEWEYFKKGRLETFGLTLPKYWHEKSKLSLFEKGYINKIWFFNDQERSAQGLWLNQDKDIFKDKRVRYAFAHAMNVQRVIEKVLRNDYFRLSQATFGYGRYTDYAIKPRPYDIQEVERLMTDAGWARGNDGIWAKNDLRFSVKVTYSHEEHMPRLVVLKEEALKAGIELLLEKLDPSASYKKVMEKKHDVGWLGWSTSMRPSYWQSWHSDNAHKPQTNNITNTDNPEMDALIDQFRASLDEEERIELSKKIQRLIHDQGAFVPTFMVPYVRIGYWRWLQLPDFYGTRRSDDLFDPFSTMTGGLFWIDPQIKQQTLDAMKKGIVFKAATIVDKQFKVE